MLGCCSQLLLCLLLLALNLQIVFYLISAFLASGPQVLLQCLAYSVACCWVNEVLLLTAGHLVLCHHLISATCPSQKKPNLSPGRKVKDNLSYQPFPCPRERKLDHGLYSRHPFLFHQIECMPQPCIPGHRASQGLPGCQAAREGVGLIVSVLPIALPV